LLVAPNSETILRRQARNKRINRRSALREGCPVDADVVLIAERRNDDLRRCLPRRAAVPGERAALLDRDNLASGVWADTAYRSATNLALLERRGLVPQFQRAKPRGKPMLAHIRRGNATRAKVRARVEHVFAAQKRRLHLVIRTIGLARATTKITLANLAYNMRRLMWIEGRTLPA
jgi:hypothetical protein